MNIPNYITILRLILIPLFVVLITAQPPKYYSALIVFIIASVTDAIDGFIAKKTNAVTPIGKFLDPMADKLLLVSAFVSLSVLRMIPVWVTVIVLSRDIIIFLGWLGVYIITGVKTIKPSIISKITTVIQMFTIIFVLMNIEINILKIFFMLTVALTFFSGLHYIIKTAIEVSKYKNDQDYSNNRKA